MPEVTKRSDQIHDCRYSFASRALALGESLPVIAKLLGHSQIQTTARYAHLARYSVKASAKRRGRTSRRCPGPATRTRSYFRVMSKAGVSGF